MQKFLTRLASGIVLVILILAVCWLGGYPLWIFTMFIGFIGLKEFYKVFDIKVSEPLGIIGYGGTAAIQAVIRISCGGDVDNQMIYLTLLVVFMLIMAAYVFQFPKYDTQKVMASFFGIVYVPVMLSFIYQTRMLEKGFGFVWLIFLASWGSDTCAYCVGMLIGKHKMTPVLSPKKTIEGGVGGVVGAALLGVIYAMVLKATAPQYDPSVPVYALICGLGAMASMVGDLAASAIKRQHGIKDYGTLIPGHGGILDRFDSVIVTAPLIYILAYLAG